MKISFPDAVTRPRRQAIKLKPIEPVFQPDAISCGATCVRMIMNALDFYPRLTIPQIMEVIGTNPVVGTTPARTLSGLDGIGVYGELKTNPLNPIATLVGLSLKQELTMFRVATPGKHWVVLDPAKKVTPDNVPVLCPSLGRIDVPMKQFLESWISRGGQALTFSPNRNWHQASREELSLDEIMDRLPKLIHETPLSAFARGMVIADHEWGAAEHRMVENAELEIRKAARDPWSRPIGYQTDDYLFRATGGDYISPVMVVQSRKTGEVVAGISHGTRWVNPDFRGQGLGRELVLAAYHDRAIRFLYPSHFSVGGFMSRVSAHREAVTRALARGLQVSESVLSAYEKGPDGQLELTAESREFIDRQMERALAPAPGAGMGMR
jgi:ABC-type bacteriocin/lantibiotic exporters, contain an N-terminal double-glycine peptidase domain